MIRSVYILGNHIQSLGIARMSKLIGMQVSLFSDYRTPVTRFSNSCNNFFLFRDTVHLYRLLETMKTGDDLPMLIPTNDKLVAFLAEHYDVFSRKFILSIPAPRILEVCLNKRLTYRSASELGVPIPESNFPDSAEQLYAMAEKIKYPVIIKPSVMHTFYRSTHRKAYLCRNRKDLVKYYELATRYIPLKEIIIQEFLQGGAASLFSYGSFAVEGKPVGSFVANRIRQKPMDFGISTTFAKTVLIPEIEKQAQKFLQGIRYTGISEVEFMYDSRKGVYKLLEINPRTWKWHSIANVLGINLIDQMVQHHEGKSLTPFRNEKENVAWVERVTDTYVVFKEILKGRMRISDYLKTMQYPKEYAAWSIRDPLPALIYLLLTPYLFFKR